MLIRSQNKMSLVKFKNIVININNISGKEIICWSQMNPGEDEYISLGHYSTKAKAMKVLDMIQEAYCKFMSVKNDDAWSGKESVFYMPEDSEVEICKDLKQQNFLADCWKKAVFLVQVNTGLEK